MTREDQRALAIFLERHHALVLTIAARVLRDTGEAEELAQEIFFEVYQRAAQFDPARGSVKAWLLQYAYHRSYNRYRSLVARRFYDHEALSPALEQPGAADNAARGGLTFEEWRHALSQRLSTLTAKQRRAIELVCFEQLTLREVAERTHEPFGAVRHHYYRAIKKLRAGLRHIIDADDGVA